MTTPVKDNVIDERMATAVHECGHVEALKRGGIHPFRVEIDDGSGVTEFRARDDQLGTVAVSYFAGQEAEADWLRRNHGFRLTDALRDTAPGARSDFECFARISETVGIGAAEARARARALVRSERANIDRLAERLHERGELGRWSI